MSTNYRLSDDSLVETQSLTKAKAIEGSLLPKGKTQDEKQKSILDIRNWLSSSDDDSFTRDMLRPSQNIVHKDTRGRPQSSFNQALLSSPTSQRISEQSLSQPSEAAKMRQRTPGHNNKAQSFLTSDPIEFSSPPSSPPRKKQKGKQNASRNSTEKQDPGGWTNKEWRHANRATRKKEEIMAEMILEVALCIDCKLKSLYFSTKFENMSVRNTYMEVPLLLWKRRVKAKYNREKDVFVPCELTEISESVYVLLYEGADLIWRIQDGTINEDLQKAKKRIAFDNPETSFHIFIVCPGFDAFLRKLQAAEDKEYRRSMLEELKSTESNGRKSKKGDPIEFTAAQALKLRVQTEINLGVNIFTCRDMDEIIDWLYTFTYTIGSSLYNKLERNPEFSNIGNVKLGSDKRTTFLNMLQQFNLVTAVKAQKISQFYPSPASMYQRFIDHEDLGSFSGKSVVPPTVNNTMRRVFMSTDPDQVITD